MKNCKSRLNTKLTFEAEDVATMEMLKKSVPIMEAIRCIAN